MYHGNVRMLSNYVASIKSISTEGELASRRILKLLTISKESFGDISVEDVKGDIDFQDVVFGYEEESLVLNKININFEKINQQLLLVKVEVEKAQFYHWQINFMMLIQEKY